VVGKWRRNFAILLKLLPFTALNAVDQGVFEGNIFVRKSTVDQDVLTVHGLGVEPTWGNDASTWRQLSPDARPDTQVIHYVQLGPLFGQPVVVIHPTEDIDPLTVVHSAVAEAWDKLAAKLLPLPHFSVHSVGIDLTHRAMTQPTKQKQLVSQRCQCGPLTRCRMDI
jgi:hypothetical protein